MQRIQGEIQGCNEGKRMAAEDKWLQHALEHHHILTPGFMSHSCTPTLGPKYGRAESE